MVLKILDSIPMGRARGFSGQSHCPGHCLPLAQECDSVMLMDASHRLHRRKQQSGETASAVAPTVPGTAGSGHAGDCMESVTDGHRVRDVVALQLQGKLAPSACRFGALRQGVCALL